MRNHLNNWPLPLLLPNLSPRPASHPLLSECTVRHFGERWILTYQNIVFDILTSRREKIFPPCNYKKKLFQPETQNFMSLSLSKYPNQQYFDKLTFITHTSRMSHCRVRKAQMKRGGSHPSPGPSHLKYVCASPGLLNLVPCAPVPWQGREDWAAEARWGGGRGSGARGGRPRSCQHNQLDYWNRKMDL